MPKQLTIDFALEHTCSECGEMFPAEALNHYETCEECVIDLELKADFQAENVARRNAALPDSCKASYEWELIRQRKYDGWIPNSE